MTSKCPSGTKLAYNDCDSKLNKTITKTTYTASKCSSWSDSGTWQNTSIAGCTNPVTCNVATQIVYSKG